MSGPAYVVIPVQGDGAQRTEQDNAKIASAIQQYNNNHSPDHEEEHPGPLKEMLAHQDSLYKYISWEDPIRTLCSYLGALGILLGAHYLPLTQLALKAGAVTLGGVSVSEFISRSFSSSFFARLRPKEYKKVPESTLNATLKDVHDLIQYSVVQAQRVLFGQDLDKTFAAFIGFTALYWLIKVLSPFSLAVLSLTSLFIAPLVASPRGREVAHDVSVRAGELTNAAVDGGMALAHDGKAKVAEGSSMARDAAVNTGRRIGDMAHSGKQTAVDASNRVMGTAADASYKAKDTAADVSSRAWGTAVDASSQAKGTAADLSNRAMGTAGDLSNRAMGTAADASNRVMGTASDASAQVKGTAVDASNRAMGTAADASSQAKGTASDLSNRAWGTAADASNQAKDTAGDMYTHVKGTEDDTTTHAGGTREYGFPQPGRTTDDAYTKPRGVSSGIPVPTSDDGKRLPGRTFDSSNHGANTITSAWHHTGQSSSPEL